MTQTRFKDYAAAGFILTVILILNSCKPTDISKENVIPKPLSMVPAGGNFELTNQTAICVPEGSEDLMKIGQYLADKLKPGTGLGLEVKATGETPASGNIYLELNEKDTELGDEGYELSINKEMVRLTAEKPAGLFHGIQTIRQLLPARVENHLLQKGPWKLATGTIRDYPAYGYRGVMLDVARHFFTVDEVKTLIDQMAYYKFNRFHLHLSDDQGWRIEIKSWPNLTTRGGSSEVGGGEGGFYTQEQYADIVKYAADRYITIIPEIDMPGHINAALASYPALNCDGKAPELYTGTDVGFSSLCTGKEITYKFIDDVIGELAALTPGQYIHIGGDESHATKIEDYIPFISRVQDIVAAHGKKVFGWDEIALSTLKPNTVAQYWAKADNAEKAVQQGAQVLMSPAKYAYLDMQYDSTSTYGLHWAGYVEVNKAYNWDPATLESGIKKENIIGVEAPLWSETVSSLPEAEYLIYPRLPGYAEIGWTPVDQRNWDDYKLRLADHGKRMKAMDISFYRSKLVPWDENNKN